MPAQFIEEWNSTFQFKLSASQLQNPNETFLFGALSSLLMHININVTKMSEESFQNEEQRHRFRTEFCHYIDGLIKICNPKESFCYFDLVCPVPKKTIYLLKLMLNFYSFYKMIRDEVVTEANEMLDAHDALQVVRNKCMRDKEMQQMRKEEIAKQRECVNASNADLLKSIEEHRLGNQNIEKMLQADQKKLTESKLRQLEMEQRQQELADQLVTDDEATELENLLVQLDAELDELATIKQDTIASHRTLFEQTGGVSENIEAANRILATFSIDEMTARKQLENQVAKLKQDINDTDVQLEHLEKSERVSRTELNRLQQVVDEKNSKLSKDNQINDRELMKLKHDKEEAVKRQSLVDEKLRSLEARLLVAERDRDFIASEAPRMLRTIADSR